MNKKNKIIKLIVTCIKNKIIRGISLAIICSSIIICEIYEIPKYLKHYDVTVVGSIRHADGFGRQSIDAIKLLDKYLNINAICIALKDTQDIDESVEDVFNRGDQLGKVMLFEHIIGNGNIIEYLRENQTFKIFNRNEQIFIAYSMFESNKIPRMWVKKLNEKFDMVVVPDPYLIDVYKNSGVTIPIFFVPLGVDLDSQLASPIKTKRSKNFLYANFSFGKESKNQLKLVQAFSKVQKIHDDVSLLINSRGAHDETKDKIMEYISNSGVKNIEYAVNSLSHDLYANILKEVDCFVYPSKGEGFSVQPREAMALGIPTIITNNTAQKTICNSDLVECVDSNIEKTAYYQEWDRVIIGNNFDCTVDDLANAMLKVYENYDDYLKQSEAARAWAANYQYENLKEKYLNMVKPKKVILGDRNEITDEYLMTNSKELYEKYKAL
jgi:hypothetical protein